MGCLSEALLISLHALAVFKRVFKVSLLVVVIFSKLKVVNLLEIGCFLCTKSRMWLSPSGSASHKSKVSFSRKKNIYIYIYEYCILTRVTFMHSLLGSSALYSQSPTCANASLLNVGWGALRSAAFGATQRSWVDL